MGIRRKAEPFLTIIGRFTNLSDRSWRDCACRIMAITQAFQACDAGSIPVGRCQVKPCDIESCYTAPGSASLLKARLQEPGVTLPGIGAAMESNSTLFRRKNSSTWYFYFMLNGRRVSRTTKKTVWCLTPCPPIRGRFSQLYPPHL